MRQKLTPANGKISQDSFQYLLEGCSVQYPLEGYFFQCSLDGHKCLGGLFKFSISRHSPRFLFLWQKKIRRKALLLLQTISCLAILAFGTVGPGILPAYAEVAVEASLSHLSFPQDKAARLNIMVTGTSRNATIELPEIDNLRLHNQGQSSQISVVNGTISSSISHKYLVQAVKPGSYTIPSIKVTAGGKSYSTKPLNFEVTPAGQQPSGYSGSTDRAKGEIAFIRISETGNHYPGEIVPFTIKAYFTQAYRADINSLPALRGDGVVMSQLQDKPRQTEESVNGRKYHVLTWDTSLSGIKVGEHPMSFSLEATMLIPQKRRSLSPFGGNSLFDDSFFNDSFFDDFFERDSTSGQFHSDNFFHNGFINHDKEIEQMMKRMDSIQQLFFNQKPRMIIPPEPDSEPKQKDMKQI